MYVQAECRHAAQPKPSSTRERRQKSPLSMPLAMAKRPATAENPIPPESRVPPKGILMYSPYFGVFCTTSLYRLREMYSYVLALKKKPDRMQKIHFAPPQVSAMYRLCNTSGQCIGPAIHGAMHSHTQLLRNQIFGGVPRFKIYIG